MLGHEVRDLQGAQILDFVHPDDVDATVRELEALNSGRTTFRFRNRYRTTVGTWRELQWASQADPARGLANAVARDVTEERRAQASLRQAAAAFRGTSEGVFITDAQNVIIDVNDAFTTITGYTREEAIGQSTNLLQSGHHDGAFYRAMWTALVERGEWRGEIWNRREDGSVYPELLTINAVRDDSGTLTGYVAVFADITTLKSTRERLEHLTHYDPLTELPNRLLFVARLREAVRRAHRDGTRLAVAFVDIDGFKNVNDAFGHPAGDELLKRVARRISGVLEGGDSVARFGSDEFVVLFEDIGDADHAGRAVAHVLETFASPFDVGGYEVSA